MKRLFTLLLISAALFAGSANASYYLNMYGDTYGNHYTYVEYRVWVPAYTYTVYVVVGYDNWGRARYAPYTYTIPGHWEIRWYYK